MTEAPRLRPLAVSETIDVSIKLYRQNFEALVKAAAVVIVPVALIQGLIDISLPGATTTGTSGQATGTVGFLSSLSASSSVSGGGWARTVGLLIVSLIGLLTAPLASAANLKVVSDAYLGAVPVWRESLHFAAGKLKSLIWLGLLTGLLLLVAFAALIVPGIWLYCSWSVAVPVLLLEGKLGRRALGRSRQLVKGRWWPVAAALLIAVILQSVLGGIVVALLAAVFGLGAHGTALYVFSLVLRGASSVFLTPFTSAVIAVIYYDLRVRKEGFDLELMARSFGDSPQPYLPPSFEGEVFSDRPPDPGVGDSAT